MSEPDVENYAISNELSIELSNISVKPIHEHRQVRLDVIENQVEYLYELWNVNSLFTGVLIQILTRGGVLPIMAYTLRLRPKGVSFSGFRYIKG